MEQLGGRNAETMNGTAERVAGTILAASRGGHERSPQPALVMVPSKPQQ